MTIALLKLTPSEYLNLAKDELDQLYTKQKYGSNPNNIESVDSTIAWLAQRFGIVLAACQLSGTFEKSEDVYEGAVRDFNGTYDSFKGMLYEVYTALISRTSTLSIGINCFPPAALKQVVDYLLPSIKMLQDCAPELSLSDNAAAQKKLYGLNDLRNDFNNIIRGSNMFSQRFYQLIYEDHEEVRKAANSKS